MAHKIYQFQMKTFKQMKITWKTWTCQLKTKQQKTY